jgi:predicted  nucleic acid-binding Zn-ribbon protein
VHPDVQKLLQLQQLDQEIARLNKDLVSLPAEEQKREKRLQTLRRTAEEKKALLQSGEVNARQNEVSIKQAEDEIKKLEGRLNTVKNNAEYQATLFQIEAVKKEKGRLEEEGIKGYEQIDALKQALTQAQGELAEEERVFAAFQEEARALRGRREAEVATVAARRPPLLHGIPRDLLERYEKLFQTRDAQAVAPIEGQICQGCYTSVTTSEYARLVGGTSIVQCGSCRRILYLRT